MQKHDIFNIKLKKYKEKFHFWRQQLIDWNIYDKSIIAISAKNDNKTIDILLALLSFNKTIVLLDPNIKKLEKKKYYQQIPWQLEINNKLLKTVKYKKNIKISNYTFNPQKASIVIFTSGSTGIPKAICHRFNSLYYSALGSGEFYNLNSKDTWAVTLPIYHIAGLMIIIRCLLFKAKYLFYNEKLTQLLIKNNNITYISLVPAQLVELIKNKHCITALKNISCVLLGGGPINKELVKKCYKLKIPISTTYGMTETASQVCATPVNTNIDELFTCGSTLKYRNIDIIDKKISISGKVLMSGIYKNGKFIPHHGRYISSDIGKIINKKLIFKRRSDNVFISGGKNIDPSEIEEVLSNHPSINQAIIIPKDHKKFGKVAVAFIRFKNEVAFENISNYLKEKLSTFKVPKIFYNLNKITQQSNKELKKQLKNYIDNNPQ